MSCYCVPTDFMLSHSQNLALKKCWDNNLGRVVQVEAKTIIDNNLAYKKVDQSKIENYGFFMLHNWIGKRKFLNNLFTDSDLLPYVDNLSIQKMSYGIEPHSDLGKTVSLLCILEGSADTIFYETKNFYPGESYRNRVEELKKVETFKLEINRFYLFNNYKIHSVENFTSPRFGISIDLTKFYENFNKAKTYFQHYSDIRFEPSST